MSDHVGRTVNRQTHSGVVSSALKGGAWCRTRLLELPKALDWCIDVMTRLLVLGLGGAGLWIAFQVLTAKDPNALLLDSVPHWPAVAVLLVPLLYRPVTNFVNEIDELFGAKRRVRDAQASDLPPLDRPTKKPGGAE